MNEKPYLSIVVASRNDDHDGTLLFRMQTFLATLLYQLSAVTLQVELIIVEWNPPENRPLLTQVLFFKNKPKNCTISVITVPRSVHTRFKNSDKLGLFQFIAKNVGIRRATGKFILSTNIDILFNTRLIWHIAKRLLKENEVVRAVRFDVPQTLPRNLHKDELLDYCWNHRIRVFWPWGTSDFSNTRHNVAADFIDNIRLTLFYGAYTNACGDFTLMHRKNWYKLRGYPEYPLHGVKLDSLLLHNAIASGIQQRILPLDCCVYHIDHAHSWSTMRRGSLIEYFQKKGVPTIDPKKYQSLLLKMKTEKRPIQYNDSDWGLSKNKLEEHIVSSK